MRVRETLKKQGKNFLNQFLPSVQVDSMTIRAFSKLTERYQISDFLTYRYAGGSGIWLADNPEGLDSFLVGFELLPLIIAGEKSTDKIASILSRLPVNTVIHSIVHVSSDIDHYLENWVDARKFGSDPIYQLISERRRQYFMDWSDKKTHPVLANSFSPRAVRYYWFVRIPVSDNKKYIVDFEKEIQSIVTSIEAEFKTGSLYVKQFNGKSLINKLKQLVNCHISPSVINKERINLSMPVNTQLLSPETSIRLTQEGDLLFSTQKQSSNHQCIRRVMSVVRFPDEPFFLSSDG